MLQSWFGVCVKEGILNHWRGTAVQGTSVGFWGIGSTGEWELAGVRIWVARLGGMDLMCAPLDSELGTTAGSWPLCGQSWEVKPQVWCLHISANSLHFPLQIQVPWMFLWIFIFFDYMYVWALFVCQPCDGIAECSWADPTQSPPGWTPATTLRLAPSRILVRHRGVMAKTWTHFCWCSIYNSVAFAVRWICESWFQSELGFLPTVSTGLLLT